MNKLNQKLLGLLLFAAGLLVLYPKPGPSVSAVSVPVAPPIQISPAVAVAPPPAPPLRTVQALHLKISNRLPASHSARHTRHKRAAQRISRR